MNFRQLGGCQKIPIYSTYILFLCLVFSHMGRGLDSDKNVQIGMVRRTLQVRNLSIYMQEQ